MSALQVYAMNYFDRIIHKLGKKSWFVRRSYFLITGVMNGGKGAYLWGVYQFGQDTIPHAQYTADEAQKEFDRFIDLLK